MPLKGLSKELFIGTLLHVFSVLCSYRIGHRFKIFYVLPSVATTWFREPS
jgi:hypothetical protein